MRSLCLMLLALGACKPDPGTDDTGADPQDSGEPDDTAPVDSDGDGFIASEDCDDDDALAYPGATERCNGQDDDCDGHVDSPPPADASDWFLDSDGDGFGDPGSAVRSCSAPDSEHVQQAGDCDDDNADVHPGATDVPYDGVDADCGGGSDFDADGDGIDSADFGGEDCNDADPLVGFDACEFEEIWAGPMYLQSIATDGNRLYVSGQGSLAGAVFSLDMGGGDEQTLHSNSVGGVQGLDVHGDTVYLGSYPLGNIYSVPSAGGSTVLLHEHFGSICGVAADDTALFYVRCSGTTIWTLPHGETTPTALVTGEQELLDVAISDTWIVWSAGGSVRRQLRTGGAVENVAIVQSAYGVGVDDTHIYWTTTAGVIRRAETDGSNLETLGNVSFGSDVAPHGSFVYVTDYNASKLYRLPKP